MHEKAGTYLKIGRLMAGLGKFLFGLSMPSHWRQAEVERG